MFHIFEQVQITRVENWVEQNNDFKSAESTFLAANPRAQEPSRRRRE